MKTPVLIFVVTMVVLSAVFFFFPIKIFDGEVIYEVDNVHKVLSGKLSLSYFIGFGYEPTDIVGVKDFYLTKQGWLMAFVVLIGFPFLLALRFYLRSKKS